MLCAEQLAGPLPRPVSHSVRHSVGCHSLPMPPPPRRGEQTRAWLRAADTQGPRGAVHTCPRAERAPFVGCMSLQRGEAPLRQDRLRELSRVPCQALRGGMGSQGIGGWSGQLLRFSRPPRCRAVRVRMWGWGLGAQACLWEGHQSDPAPQRPHPLLMWTLVAVSCCPRSLCPSSGKRREKGTAFLVQGRPGAGHHSSCWCL